MFGVGAKIDTLLGEGAEFKGNITVEGSIVIDGRIEGNVTASERITIGTHGNVKGDLTSREVVVGGVAQGNIAASDRAELLVSAKVAGDIRSPKIAMDEGAQLTGKIGTDPAPVQAAVELHLAQN